MNISRRHFISKSVLAGLGLLASASSFMGSDFAFADTGERVSVSFDLAGPENQSQTIILSDGTEVTVGIEKPAQTRDGYSESLGNGYGDFKTYWYTGVLNIHYWIRVDNYLISYCYGEFAGAATGPIYSIVVDWTNLDWGSTWCRMATRYHHGGFGIYETKFIEGRINGTVITYEFWIV